MVNAALSMDGYLYCRMVKKWLIVYMLLFSFSIYHENDANYLFLKARYKYRSSSTLGFVKISDFPKHSCIHFPINNLCSFSRVEKR